MDPHIVWSNYLAFGKLLARVAMNEVLVIQSTVLNMISLLHKTWCLRENEMEIL